MKSQKKKKLPTAARSRRDERGAALIMMLLVSMLLLAAGGALIMTTALTTTTVYESTPETLAYYAAETGLEDTLNVLRGNGQASAAPSCAPAVADPEKISFRRALVRCTSNLSADSQAATFPLRLSRWLNYNYQPPNLDYPDRVALTPGYSPLNGTAYSIALKDPDTSHVVSYSVTGKFNNGGSSTPLFGNGADTAILTYTPPSPVTTTAYPAVQASLGTLRAQYTLPNGAEVPSHTTLTLTINQIAPWPATYTIINKVTGTVGPGALNNVKIVYGEQTVVLGGTTLQLPTSLNLISALLGSGGGDNELMATLTAPEPRRLVVTSTGYGPRGAKKYLEMTLDNFNFAIRPPAPISIRGSDNPAQPMTFDLGSSNAKRYSGVDISGQQPVAPAVAITLHDWNEAKDGIKKGATVQPVPPAQAGDPQLAILDHTIPPSTVADPNPIPMPWVAPSPVPLPGEVPPPAVTPDFLRTANAAREFLYGANGSGGLRAKAKSQNRYYSTPFNGVAGSYADGGFTFVDGNCELDGGGGLLVVTGDLVLKGNSDFRGIILVMGNGRVTRSGGGNANIRGAWIVANFGLNGPGNFGAPTFDVSGGGGSEFQFDWAAIVSANRAVGLSLTGIAER